MVGILEWIHRLEKWSVEKSEQAETLNEEFWNPIFAETDFSDFIKSQYSIGLAQKVDMDKIVEEQNG